jgi:hypothetical protein
LLEADLMAEYVFEPVIKSEVRQPHCFPPKLAAIL